MSIVTDLGKQGPHPNVLPSLVEQLNSFYVPDSDARLRESDIEVLQQRTLYGLRWTNLWIDSEGNVEDVRVVDVSVGLVRYPIPGERNRLEMYQAYRLEDRDWGLARMSGTWLDKPPTKQWAEVVQLARGLGIAWGILAQPTRIGKGRLILADGQIHESMNENGSFLVFMPFSSADLWSSAVTIDIFDTEGREILSKPYPLDLESLHSQTHC